MADLELMNLRIITAQTPESPLTSEEAAVLGRHEGRIILIHIDGPMSFGSAKDMVRRLEGVSRWSSFSVVVLDLSAVPTIDGTAALAVEDMIRMAESHQQHLVLVGIQPAVTEVLKGLGVLRLVPSGHHHGSRLDALHHAARLVTSSVSP